MLSLKEVLAQEHNSEKFLEMIDSQISLRLGNCYYCNFHNKKSFKSKNLMDEDEFHLLAVYESEFGKYRPEKRPMMPIKINNVWFAACLVCVKN